MTNHADLIAALRIPMNVTLPDAPELDEYDEQRKAAADRIEELEAKLAKAVEALQLYACGCDATEANQCGYEGNLCCMTARTTIAEINGGGDE